MALLLALIRKIPLSNKLVQTGRWEMPAVVPIRRIEGTVLGLIGFGHIPRLVAPKAQAFGMRVISYDPFAKPDVFKAAGAEGVDLDTLLKTSDYVSVHAPLLPATRGMLNATAFSKMKKGAYVVNTARGPLIDEPDLIAALILARWAAPDSTWWPPSHLPRIHHSWGATTSLYLLTLRSIRSKR